mgnify:CR=1 FL=1
MIKRNNIKAFLSKSKFNLAEADIRDKASLDKIFRKFKIHKVIHLAAQPGVSFSLENPFSPYGVSKRTGELLCFNYNYLYHPPVTILRFFTVYGPKQRPDMAIYKFAKLINDEKETTLFGNGETKRDYTFIDDIINGITTCLRKDFDFQIFNLGYSKPITLLYLISLIEKNLKKKAKIKFLPSQLGDPPITYADITKSKELLNFHPGVSIEEGIKNFIQWYKHEKT